ncbi:helix-turn-helix domain-containing protein [Helcococcus kunzii]|uniref:helix-turn-helix domain-containing protein n=1 Tax=Helcococcus kunzii TaxID=40091 RepID=UPI0024AE4250|nr:helix-turn-helix transcriptional regulator [Helcococcus kunzii]
MKLNINKINIIKAEKGLNNTDIAELTGISRPWLSTVFNREKVSPQIVHKLAKGLNVEVSEILLNE